MNRTVIGATLGCLAAQLAMVLYGHSHMEFRALGFAIGGMLISLLAGLAAGRPSRGWLGAIGNGALAGGFGALAGIAVSTWLGDVPPALMGMGTGASTLAGMAGAALTYGLRQPAR
jgi:hypothetical protein